jgi:signal transduction histidine kinase/ActR/RegA family two-component response regulator
VKIDVAKRLSVRLTWYTVLWALALGLLLNLFQVTIDYFNASRDMDEDIRALLEISHSPASQIAYNIDTRLAEELLEGLLRHPAIVKASIVDPDGKTLADRERQLPRSPYRWLSDMLFGAERSYASELQVGALADIELGRLRLDVDTYHYGTSFLRRAAQTILSGFAKSLILAVILLVVFYLVLTKPLFRVIRSLAQVDTEEPEKIRLPTPGGHSDDEIGLLVRITNEHLDIIDGNLQKLRRAEGRLKDYNEQLAQTVEARTREISDKNQALQRSNRALINAKEDAVSRAHARADFLASMSHEIRTPLNGLLGMLSLSMEEEMTPSQRNRLEIAHLAGQSLLGLLNDILDISKVEAGKLDLEHIPFNLRELAEESATLLSEQGRRKGIDVVIQVAPDLPEQLTGDPTRLRQVINNLLSNGIKFTLRGEVRLSIDYSKGEARIRVSDTGIGLSAEDQRKIFAPFSQANSETTRRFGGTGLGLTLCRQLVERMHGQITVDSQENRGTTFLVRIPLATVSDLKSAPKGSVFANRRLAIEVAKTNPHLKALRDQLSYWDVELTDSANNRPVDAVIRDADSVRGNSQTAPGIPVVYLGELPRSRWPSRTPPLQIALPLILSQLTATLNQALFPQQDTGSVETPASQENAHSLSVLLVEDNRVNQIVASGMLRKLGHEVELAENGERALIALKQRVYDVVLMDVQMPVMDGYEATRRIRDTLKLDTVPVIAVTANVMQGDREACMEAGMNDYITKPYSLDALRSKLGEWVPATG